MARHEIFIRNKKKEKKKKNPTRVIDVLKSINPVAVGTHSKNSFSLQAFFPHKISQLLDDDGNANVVRRNE
jgi:hypothetical protein